MKKKNLMRGIVLVIAISTVGLILKSCSTKESTKCSSCEQPSNYNLVTKFDNTLGNVSANSRIWRDKKTVGYEYADVIINEAQKFNSISASVESQFPVAKNAENIVLAYAFYRQGNLENDSLMTMKDVYGISRYYFNSNKMYHQFFIKNLQTNNFEEIIELNSEIDAIVSNYMHTISTEIIKFKGNFASVFVADATKSDLEQKVKNSYDMLERKLKNYIKANLKNSDNSSSQNILKPAPGDGDGNCGNPCVEPGKKKCTLRLGGYHACGGSCDFKIATTILSDSNVWIANDSMNLTYRSDIHYNFRDSILAKTLFGQKYIDYYYALGDDFSDKLDINSILYTGRILLDVNSLVTRLTSTSENPSNVLINSSTKQKIVDILNFYKAKTSNTDSINRINEIINDMNNMEGMSVAQVRTMLSI